MTKRNQSSAVLFALVLILSLAVTVEVSGQRMRGVLRPTPPSDPAIAFEWLESVPEAEEMDSGSLAIAADEFGSRWYTYSLLVIRHGRLVAEHYFHGAYRDQARHIHSASKSFTSAMVGAAVDRGFIRSLDEKVLDYFPEYANSGLDPRKFDITIRHLLTMTAGFDWVEQLSSFERLLSHPDWVKATIELPLRRNPGAEFNYCTPSTDLLAALVARATGMPLPDFASQYLLDPMGITIKKWMKDPQGNFLGGRAMFVTPRNMARLGYLYLSGGSLNGYQVLSPSWVTESTTRHLPVSWNWGALKESGYGYQWWTGTLGGHPMFYASGKGGQFILCIPDLDMVVVTTTNGEAWEGEWLQIQDTLDFVATFVLAAVWGDRAPPPWAPASASGRMVERPGPQYPYFVNEINWFAEPRNAGLDVIGYRLYRIRDGIASFLIEVEPNSFSYEIPYVSSGKRYAYGVTSVTRDGRESIAAIVSISPPEQPVSD